MLNVVIEPSCIRFGTRFTVSFQRTVRVPDDGRTYPLPSGLGRFPVRKVEDYRQRVPRDWLDQGGAFLPVYQREALWLAFSAAYWKPNAVKVAVGQVNVVTGESMSDGLHEDPQDYMVCPDQPWLDGINVGEDHIRQFVAMPLGSGFTVESQVSGSERYGGLQIQVFEPRPGLFPEHPPETSDRAEIRESAPPRWGGTMGLAAGGVLRQRIYRDRYGLACWDQNNRACAAVHLVNSEQFFAITGEQPPPTPIDAQTYAELGLPWYELYDESRASLGSDSPERLTRVRSIGQLDAAKNQVTDQDDAGLENRDDQIRKVKLP